MSQVTTHVLDTGKGRPAWGVAVHLFEKISDEWFEIAKGITNKEGRLMNLLEEDMELALGTYKISFDVRHYFSADDIKCFYPLVEIIFEVTSIGHYHIPLLISPYGYTTFRGN
jgi:5-hydroxyisourate hydrolase